MNSRYQYRSHIMESNGKLRKSNLGSRPYTTIEKVLADPDLADPRYYIHDFIHDTWHQVINGWLTSVESPVESPVENKPLENKDNPTMTSLSNPTVVVEVLDTDLGKGNIVDHGGNKAMIDNTIYKGPLFTSKELRGYPVGTTLLCEIEIMPKGTRKVRSVAPYVLSQDKEPSNEIVAVVEESIVVKSDTVDSSPVKSDTVDIPSIVVDDVEPIVSLPIVPIAKTLNQLDFREWNSDKFYVSFDAQKKFRTAYNLIRLNSNQPVRLMLTGDSGNGKSSLAKSFAAFVGLDFVFVNCATMRDVNDWFGQILVEAPNGASEMRYEPSEFADYMQRGNCVICLDEFNRVSPELHNALFPILDDRGETTVNKMTFKVGPNVIFVGTVNLGWTYNGTSEIDAAMFNRFDMILEVHSLPFDVETSLLQTMTGIESDEAEMIVKIATMIRDNQMASCSTRSTLSIARMMQADLDIVDAFDANIVCRIPSDDTGNVIRKNLKDGIQSMIVNGSATL